MVARFPIFSTRTGSSSPDSALRVFKGASEAVGVTLDDVNYCVGTGYGRVNVPFAQRTITEIACHARGANYMAGSGIRTILDMGGQDCKVIHCDERGKVLNFIMNDKCAAGTGRGMEVIADVLSVPIEDIGRRSFEIDEEPPPVSNVCTVFAKSEATTLLRAGWSVNRVLAAYCAAMAQRVAGLIERMEVERDFFITGGIGKNIGVTRRIERLIGVEAVRATVGLGASTRRSPARWAPPCSPIPSTAKRTVIANYGYEDGSGFYYITIDGDTCATCAERGCVPACPQGVYAVEMDDYDDYVAVVVETARKKLRELCSMCKGQRGGRGCGQPATVHRRLPGGRPEAQLVMAGSLYAYVDGVGVSLEIGASLLEACDAAGRYVPQTVLSSRCRLGLRVRDGRRAECGLCVVRIADGSTVLACSHRSRRRRESVHGRPGAAEAAGGAARRPACAVTPMSA